MSLLVTHLGFSDKIGGAAIASSRLNEALNSNPNINISSSMRVAQKVSNQSNIEEAFNSPVLKFWNRRLPSFNQKFAFNFNSRYNSYNNYAILPTGLNSQLKKYLERNDRIINLHWLGSRILSLWEIGQLPRNVVWTMHDQWAICGGEHYDTNSIISSDKNGYDSRFSNSYSIGSRSSTESGFDINRLCWSLKKKFWNSFSPSIVCPSNWMKSCIEKSELFNSSIIRVIPNCIDTTKWKSIEKNVARDLIGLPLNAKVLLFGAFSDLADKRKGGDLLIKSLNHLTSFQAEDNKFQLLVFGPSSSLMSKNLKCPVHFLGHLDDDHSLITAYSAADIVLLPSRLDNLPNVGLEAFSCSTPVVTFNSGGILDIVDDRENGRVSPDFSPLSFSECISWCLENPQRLRILGENARRKAVAKWHYNVVSSLYSEMYHDLNSKLNLSQYKFIS